MSSGYDVVDDIPINSHTLLTVVHRTEGNGDPSIRFIKLLILDLLFSGGFYIRDLTSCRSCTEVPALIEIFEGVYESSLG